MSDFGHEIFDTNYDYHYAAEQRQSGEKGLVQKMGAKALKWFRGMNEKRKVEKAERKYNGSLQEISPRISPAPPAAPKEAQPVAAEPGMYRSRFSGEQPAPAMTEPETDAIMNRAIHRARKNLGALPLIAMHRPEQPGTVQRPESATPYRDESKLQDTEPGQDEELLQRLRRAYAQPATEPDRSDHTAAGAEDSDQLASTKGK
jgi:hypothetical protein